MTCVMNKMYSKPKTVITDQWLSVNHVNQVTSELGERCNESNVEKENTGLSLN